MTNDWLLIQCVIILFSFKVAKVAASAQKECNSIMSMQSYLPACSPQLAPFKLPTPASQADKQLLDFKISDNTVSHCPRNEAQLSNVLPNRKR